MQKSERGNSITRRSAFANCRITYRSGLRTVRAALAAKAWARSRPARWAMKSCFNPALQFDDEQEFVDYILTDQPETPFYFAVMKRVNKVGPELTKILAPVTRIVLTELAATAAKHLVHRHKPGQRVCTRRTSRARSMCRRRISCSGLDSLSTTAKPIYLIADEKSLPAQLRSLRSIGIDNVGGFFDAAAIKADGLRTESYRSATPVELLRKHRRWRRHAHRRACGDGISCWAHRRRRAPLPRHAVAEYPKH